MRTTNIVDSNVERFASILSMDEIIGIEEGRLSALGAYNEETGEAQGVLVGEIDEDLFEIRSIRVEESSRNQGIAKALLDIAVDIPEEFDLQIYTTNSENVEFLKKNGFEELESDYYYICGTIGDLIDISKPKSIRNGTQLTTLEAITNSELRAFAIEEHPDEFSHHPEKVPHIASFSTGSIACKVNGILEAVILIEEFSDYLRIIYLQGKKPESLYLCLAVLKDELRNDYEDDTRLKIVAYSADEEKRIRSLMHDGGQSEKVRVFKYSV